MHGFFSFMREGCANISSLMYFTCGISSSLRENVQASMIFLR